MRSHWASCHGIDQGDILLPMVIPVLLKEKVPNTGLMAAVGTGNPGQDGPPGGNTGPGADARPAGGPGTSNTERGGRPKGTAGSSGEAGKRSEKGQKVGNRSTTSGRGGKGSFTSYSAKRVMALRANKVLDEIKMRDKAIKLASKNAKRQGVIKAADLITGSTGNPGQGSQPEGATSLGDEAGPSNEVEVAKEVTESPAVITNPEEGMVELDAMDVEIAQDMANVNVEIAQDMANIFRNMPYRLEKK